MIRSVLKKRPIITALEKNKGAKDSNSKKMPYSKREIREFSVFPPFLCGAKIVVALLEHWVKDKGTRFQKWSSFLLQQIRKIWSTIHSIERKDICWNSVTLF